MPVREMTPGRTQEYQSLVSGLLAEWNDPASQRQEPLIVLEREPRHGLISIYVVWNDWASVDRSVRAEVIMDAAQAKLSASDLNNVTVAMGLTPAEAKSAGLTFNSSQHSA